jgi:hypothetical protein
MTNNLITELESRMGNGILNVIIKYGVTLIARYIVNKSYVKNELFLHLMERFKHQFKDEIIYIRDGNFLSIEYRDGIDAEEFIKRFDRIYSGNANIVESHVTDDTVFVIIKPIDEIYENIVLCDLKNCGFEVVNNEYFIHAVARLKSD